MHNVSIVSNGDRIRGWQKTSIKRSIKHLAGSFDIAFSDSWINEFPEVYVGLNCEIQIDDTSVIKGFIDRIDPYIEPGKIGISLSGREKTGDLVDCNLIDKPLTWKNQNIYQIFKSICSQFNLDVLIEDSNPGSKFSVTSIKHDEKIFDYLNKLAKQRNFIVITDLDGTILLTRAGKHRSTDSLIEGKNLHKIYGKFSFEKRFSDYKIRGQQRVEGVWSTTSVSITAKAEDQQILRYRPISIEPDSQVSIETAQNIVNWEAQVRKGRSLGFEVVQPGWTQSNGALWSENLLVNIECPKLRVIGDYLIESITYELDDKQQFCRMSFVDPSTYAIPIKVIKKPSKPRNTYGWVK